MLILRMGVLMGLSLWVGSLALFMGVVTPAIFKNLPKEEAGKVVGILFPAVDRWLLACAAVAVGSLFFLFLNRHFALSSLFLEIPVGLMVVLTLYTSLVLHPQIRELKRTMNLSSFQGTTHQQTIQFTFNRLHLRSVQLNTAILALGLLSLGLTPKFLK